MTHRTHTNFADFPQVTRMKMAPQKDLSSYSKLLKPTANANDSEQTSRGTRSFSQNPQEAEVPPILIFQSNPAPQSYAKAASRSNPTTASTQISTISSDQLRTVEREMRSLRAEWGAMKNSKIDENTQQGEKPPSEETGTQAMFLEVLKRMDSHTASMDHLTAASKARFDTLEGHQTVRCCIRDGRNEG